MVEYKTVEVKIMFFVACVGGYLFGSLPWALIIGKVFYKKDIRNFGSGNLGGSNAGRVLGKKAGVSVTILDALKAFFVVWFCQLFVPSAASVAGLCCCLGHCFPIFARFKGGKAVATTYGYLLGISVFATNQFILMFLVPLLIFFLSLKLCKMVSLSSLIGITSAALFTTIFQQNWMITSSVWILLLFVAYRHKENFKRIQRHEEKKITWM